jgi:hypothetical protein
MNCYNVTISGCPNTISTGIVVDYGYIPGNATPQNGIIVLLSGGSGESPSPEDENKFVTDYVNNGYGVIEVAWRTGWELTQGNIGDSTYGVRYAACWPATLLYYFYNTYVVPLRQPSINPHAGMCVQGFSGGSAALGYALAWYGAYSYVDKAGMLSGPVFSDIEQGCIRPPAANQYVCGGSPSWCQLGTPPGPPYQAPWYNAPAYQDPVTSAVRLLSNDATCAYAASGFMTSPQSNQNWLNMSIVNQSGGTFDYPNTKVTGWVCASVYQNAQQMNNSSAQGQIFFAALGAAGSPQFSLYAVQNCDDPEGVQTRDAVAPALPTECDSNGQYCGYTAIKDDMIDPARSQTGVCKH